MSDIIKIIRLGKNKKEVSAEHRLHFCAKHCLIITSMILSVNKNGQAEYIYRSQRKLFVSLIFQISKGGALVFFQYGF